MALPNKDPYVRACYAALLRGAANLDDKDNWAGYIRKLLTLYGGPEGTAMWETQARLWSGNRIREVVETECDRLHELELLEVQRLAFLRTSHGSGFGVSVALQVSVEAHRRDLLRLLCSGHPLAIEAGRHTNTPRDQRRCLQDVTETEDEHHCLFECSLNADLRLVLEGKLNSVGRMWGTGTWAWILQTVPYRD